MQNVNNNSPLCTYVDLGKDIKLLTTYELKLWHVCCTTQFYGCIFHTHKKQHMNDS